MHVVICGGGVIGTAAAFELSKRSVDVTLIERWRIAGCASGKSGGFLARDWCAGSPVDRLARRSFDLHEDWAAELGNPYGYRKVTTFSAIVSPRALHAARDSSGMANWLSPSATHRQRIGDETSTAQLDPAAFTNALMQAAIARGAKLVIATVKGLQKSADQSRITGVELEGGETVEADAVILALGPWSLLAAQWLALPPVYGLKGHSLIFRPEIPLPAEALFAEIEDAEGNSNTPEIVSRADGTVYVCGLPGRGALPVAPSAVHPEAGGSARLLDLTLQLVPSLKSAEIIADQACFRPVTADGMPFIGPAAGAEGGYIATGHSVWGMLNAPGTAEALADIILGNEPAHVSLRPFSPSRLAPLDPAELELRST